MIEFLGLWERLHNPDFKPLEFEGFRKQAGANAFTMNTEKIGKSAAIWKEAVRELQNNQLIMAVGNKNEIFQLTRLGYEVSEKI